MNKDLENKKKIEGLLDSQLYCVLTTNLEHSNFPYSSLVAFLHSDNLKYIYFATSKNTTKFTNILSDPKVCLFFDNRSNELKDVTEAITATVLGKVEDRNKETDKECFSQFLDKYPQLTDFAKKSSTAFLRINVEEYIVVYSFQKVLRLKL
jgi:general stress protein 26